MRSWDRRLPMLDVAHHDSFSTMVETRPITRHHSFSVSSGQVLRSLRGPMRALQTVFDPVEEWRMLIQAYSA